MVDRLKRSLEEIASPTCPTCHVDMPWFQSKMIELEPVTIEHMFVCPSCRRTETRTAIVKGRSAGPTSPRKLSAPYLRLVISQ